jgi:hypothetical protein
MVAFEGRDKLASVLEVIGYADIVGCFLISVLMGESFIADLWLLVCIIERYSHIPAAFRGDASWMRSFELWCHAEDTYRRESGVDGDGSPAAESGGGVGLTPLVKPGQGSGQGSGEASGADDKVTVVVMDGDGGGAGVGGRELRTASGGAGNKLADALAGKVARPTVAVVEAGGKRAGAAPVVTGDTAGASPAGSRRKDSSGSGGGDAAKSPSRAERARAPASGASARAAIPVLAAPPPAPTSGGALRGLATYGGLRAVDGADSDADGNAVGESHMHMPHVHGSNRGLTGRTQASTARMTVTSDGSTRYEYAPSDADAAAAGGGGASPLPVGAPDPSERL